MRNYRVQPIDNFLGLFQPNLTYHSYYSDVRCVIQHTSAITHQFEFLNVIQYSMVKSDCQGVEILDRIRQSRPSSRLHRPLPPYSVARLLLIRLDCSLLQSPWSTGSGGGAVGVMTMDYTDVSINHSFNYSQTMGVSGEHLLHTHINLQ